MEPPTERRRSSTTLAKIGLETLPLTHLDFAGRLGRNVKTVTGPLLNKIPAALPKEELRIVEANLDDPAHQEAVLSMVDAYSLDEMGDGKPLSEGARCFLVSRLREHPTTLIFLAFQGKAPVGIAVCFRGFSTFAARPLLNIHDLAVLPANRGEGVGRQLLQSVEKKAREMGCCKLTLEVLEKNGRAREVYESAGFGKPVYQDKSSVTFFLSKPL